MIRRTSYLPLWLEAVALLVARLSYRVRAFETGLVPVSGGAVVVANHLTYMDVVILQLACPRRLRFVAYAGPGIGGFLNWVYSTAGVIRIRPDRVTQGLRAAVAAAEGGDLVCLFPEGQISRTGHLMALKEGYRLIARRAAVPVLPAAIDGLWDSVFSFAGNRFLWKAPRLKRTEVRVVFGAPIAAAECDGARLRRALLDLGAEAFSRRPVLRRHLGREAIRSLARRPGAVVVIDRTAERRPVTSAQLLALAGILARRWRSIPERRVGIVLPSSAGAIVANLAVVCAGKIPVNFNFTAGRRSLEASLRASGVRTVITAAAMRERLPEFPWPESTLDLRAEIAAAGGPWAMLPWLGAAWLLPNQWVAALFRLPSESDDAEAALLFTSGSAGDPKGVVLSHANLLANGAQISSTSILPPTARLLACLPIFHSFGFMVTLWYPLLRGCSVVTVPSPLDTRRMIDAIKEEGVTVLVAAPSFLRPFLKKAAASELRSLDLVVAGAEKLPGELHRAFLEAFHIDILEGYGLTETSPVAGVNHPNPPLATGTSQPQVGKRLGTVGRLLPGITARIVHPESGAELSAGETGLLCFRGPNVFEGYLGEDGRAVSALRKGWFVTGDLAHFDTDGFLTIAGRLARFSKMAGEMVPHGLVEQRITEAFGIDSGEGPQIAVTAIPDIGKGESLVVLTTVEMMPAVLRERLANAGLPNLWIPRLVIRLERIPVLATGKLDLAGCRNAALSAQ